MSEFASKSYSCQGYAQSRPSYSPEIINEVLDYHKGDRNLCIDLGCGPAVLTKDIHQHFNQVLGIDPSSSMIDEANNQMKGVQNVTFKQGLANEIANLIPQPADLIVSAEAAHWFHKDPSEDSEIWREIGKSLKKGGSLVYLVYGDIILLSQPYSKAFDKVLDAISQYWESGREQVPTLYRGIQFPSWSVNSQRREYGEGQWKLRKKISIDEFVAYISSYSAVNNYLQQPSSNKNILSELKSELSNEVKGNDLDVAWPFAFMMCQK